jgi:hypothetical protein
MGGHWKIKTGKGSLAKGLFFFCHPMGGEEKREKGKKNQKGIDSCFFPWYNFFRTEV